MLATAFRDNIQAATIVQVDSMHFAFDTIFQAILRDVKSLVLRKTEHPSEKRVRQDVTKFVIGAEPLLEAIKESLQTIESSYTLASMG